MVLDLVPDDIGISVSYPLPGTKFYDKVKADFGVKQNWSDSDDLALMFKNTYPPIFYKTLHRYVHNRYRIKKGWLRIKNVLKELARGMAKDLARMMYHLPMAGVNRILLQRYSSSKHS